MPTNIIINHADRKYAYNYTTNTCSRRYPVYGFSAAYQSSVGRAAPTSTTAYYITNPTATAPLFLFNTGSLTGYLFVAPASGFYAVHTNTRINCFGFNPQTFIVGIAKNAFFNTQNGMSSINTAAPYNSGRF